MEHDRDIITIKRVDTKEEIADFEYAPTEKRNSAETKAYESFTDYSHNERPKDYQEYEIIQTYSPKKKVKKDTAFQNLLKEHNSFQEDKETIIYEKVKPQKLLKRTNKIFICVACCIAVLMGTLGIINTVKINNLTLSNASQAEQIANVGKEIVKVDQVIEGITSEQNVKENAEQDGLEQITVEHTIQLNEKKQVTEDQGKTNFFDKICNFIIHLFGG